ncbi:HlyD family efflux transporter periplasmic adaptor subunit [Phenylobacterium sp.]|uniref:HlyD family secretion protein n=1 Tax=Phenylobacterium sp. TaxID=1871053 RepID=UPI0025F0646A|nr:HlyD family efflux transporter periplasmic adaptor subunit [Phenylobacterium sp.]
MARDQGPSADAATASPPATSAPPPAANPQRGRRTRLLLTLAAVVLGAALIWLAYWLLVGSRHVETDDAYVQASSAQITALVSGPLVQVPIHETLTVKQGQVLAVIDPADYRLAVERARADLEQAERRVRQYFANDEALSAQTEARNADIARAQAELRRAEVEYGRRKGLAGQGAVSGDELTAAETSLTTARAALTQARANATAARQQQRAANVLIEGRDVAGNPEVAAARARLAQAELDLARTVIRSPTDGVVTRNTVEVGQRVQPGAALMTVVPIQRAYVDANFKEGQLRKVKVGQPVTLTSDLYGSRVKFHGRVQGFSGGTGSAFAVIPAQNATGNWIKVVQRVPVRIALDPKELAEHPLRVGLSMTAEIDIGG